MPPYIDLAERMRVERSHGGTAKTPRTPSVLGDAGYRPNPTIWRTQGQPAPTGLRERNTRQQLRRRRAGCARDDLDPGDALAHLSRGLGPLSLLLRTRRGIPSGGP